MDSQKINKAKIEPVIFIPPLIVAAAFCIWIFRAGEGAAVSLGKAFNFVTNNLAWVFEWYTLLLFGLCIFFVFGPYAKKRLGDEKPEFSTLTWLGMIFTSTCGVGVLFWTSIEFFYYIQTPPFGIEPFSVQSYEWALTYPFFHWGFTAWSMNAVFGLVFAYLFFVKKKSVVRPSTACEPLLGKSLANGWLGKVIDIFFVIGFLGGVTTCVGVNTPIILELFSKVLGIEQTLSVKTAIILSWTVFMAMVVYTGLNKGIRILSDFRVYIGFGVLGFMLLFGPTSYILNTFTDTIGHLMQNWVRLSLYTDPHNGSGVPQGWTVFYWAWYLALALQAGIYFGRISKGRTVREFIIGALMAGTAGSWMFFMVFTNFSMYTHVNNLVPINEIMNSQGAASAIVAIWSQLPFSGIVLAVLLFYGYISMETLLNGAAYTLAMVTTKELSGEEEPPKWNRIFWSLTIGIIAVALVYIGGLKPSQTTTVVGGVPMFFITAMILLAFFKDVRTQWGESEKDLEDENGKKVDVKSIA